MGLENIYTSNNNVLLQCVQNMLFDCWLIRMKMKNATSKNCNVFGEPLFASACHLDKRARTAGWLVSSRELPDPFRFPHRLR